MQLNWRTNLSENQCNKNDVAEFGAQIYQKTDQTRMMQLNLESKSIRKPMEQE